MAVARLVAIAGPDKGHIFDLPLRGGGIGRDVGNVVQLSDLSVSRTHCQLQLREGAFTLIDAGGRNRVWINDQPMAVGGAHALQPGDEITVGKTRLLYQPVAPPQATAEGEAKDATGPRSSTAVRVTMEIASRELLTAGGRDMPGSESSRARRHLAALARLGDSLRTIEDRQQLGHLACEQAMAALSGQRAFLMLQDSLGRITPCAVVATRGTDEHVTTMLPKPLIVDRVLRQGKALTVDTPEGGPCVIAPIHGLSGPESVSNTSERAPEAMGLMAVERPVGAGFDDVDLMAMVTLAHLTSAALSSLDARAALAQDNRALSQQLGGREFIGESEPARALRAFVAKVGPSTATVLLTGESGSGKEMVARAIHQSSRRAHAPFVAVNCAALTESLIESELFGHEKGAFTGATERKQGRFELADRGTLFLDEVGELPLSCQTKFLRVLEEQVFERVGGSRSLTVDVRVVAATNRDLLAMVQRGGFREDLYYRLSVIHTVVPPLRLRKSDVPRLAAHFLEHLRHQVPRRIEGFAPAALQALEEYDWPGNVRELKNAIERAIVLGATTRIEHGDLPPHIIQPHADADAAGVDPATARTQPLTVGPRHRMPTAPFAAAPGYPTYDPRTHARPRPVVAPTPPAGVPVVIPPQPLRELEKQGIIAALRATGGNKAQAAQLLEIDRSTLYKKLKDYGIT